MKKFLLLCLASVSFLGSHSIFADETTDSDDETIVQAPVPSPQEPTSEPQ